MFPKMCALPLPTHNMSHLTQRLEILINTGISAQSTACANKIEYEINSHRLSVRGRWKVLCVCPKRGSAVL